MKKTSFTEKYSIKIEGDPLEYLGDCLFGRGTIIRLRKDLRLTERVPLEGEFIVLRIRDHDFIYGDLATGRRYIGEPEYVDAIVRWVEICRDMEELIGEVGPYWGVLLCTGLLDDGLLETLETSDLKALHECLKDDASDTYENGIKKEIQDLLVARGEIVLDLLTGEWAGWVCRYKRYEPCVFLMKEGKKLFCALYGNQKKLKRLFQKIEFKEICGQDYCPGRPGTISRDAVPKWMINSD